MSTFSIVVLPDTQITIQDYPDDFRSMGSYINQLATSSTVSAVLHVGDIVEWPRAKDWTVARNVLNELTSPWTFCVGNHDYDNWDGNVDVAGSNALTNVNTYLPYSETSARPGHVSAFPAGTVNNLAREFTAGGIMWLVVSLGYVPDSSEISWANDLIADYPNHNVIILTHDYLQAGGSRSPAGQVVWEQVASKWPNVRFVICGHIPASTMRTDTGRFGNTIHQIMVDYQDYSNREPNSYLRIMEFDTEKKTCTSRTYSPALFSTMPGQDHAFTISGLNWLAENNTPTPAPAPPEGDTPMRRYPTVRTGPVGERIIAFVETYYPKADEMYVTSGMDGDHGATSHHYGLAWNGSPTAAIDFGAYDGVGTAEGDRRMRDFAKWCEDNYTQQLVELIHTTPYQDDAGFYVSQGARSSFDPATTAAHLNHVHVAFSAASLDAAIAKSTPATPAPTPPPPPADTQPAPQPAPAPAAGIPPGSFGVDYAFARPNIDAMKASNVTFAFRYLSFENGSTQPKILRNDEALALSQAGIAVVSNYEWYAERCTEGADAGAEDARTAIDQARAAGAPDGKPVYFSVDTDVDAGAVTAYFQGIASVIPVEQIGVYGSYRVVKGLKEAGLVTWCWQTYAWSGGQWYDGNHVEQYQNSQSLAGGDVDFCRNKQADFGQWFHTAVAQPQQTPAPNPQPTPAAENVAGPAMNERTLDVKINDLWANELAGTSGYVANSPSRRASQIARIEKALADKLSEQTTPTGAIDPASMGDRSIDVKINDLWTQEMFGTSGYVTYSAPSLQQVRLDHIEAMVAKLLQQ